MNQSGYLRNSDTSSASSGDTPGGSCSRSSSEAPTTTSIFQVIDPDTFDLWLAVPKENVVNLIGAKEDIGASGALLGRNFLKKHFHPQDLGKLFEVRDMAAKEINLEENLSIQQW